MGKFSALKRKAVKKAKKKIKEEPKPKFKADRKVDPSITEALKKQNETTRNAPKKSSGRAFEQTQAEKAADKAPKPKTDTRVAEAGGNVTKAQQDRINAAPSTQALTSLKSTLNKEVDALKTLTDGEKKRRKQKISTLVDNAKDKIRAKGEKAAKRKGSDTRPAAVLVAPQTAHSHLLPKRRTPSRVCGADILGLPPRLPLISFCPFPGRRRGKMTSEARGRLFVMYDLWPMRQLVSRRPPLPFDRPHDPTHPFSSCAACSTRKRVARTAPARRGHLARRRPSFALSALVNRRCEKATSVELRPARACLI